MKGGGGHGVSGRERPGDGGLENDAQDARVPRGARHRRHRQRHHSPDRGWVHQSSLSDLKSDLSRISGKFYLIWN